MTHEGFQVNMQAFVTPSTILSISALATDSTFDTEVGETITSAAVGVIQKGSTTVDPHNPTQATSFTEFAVADLQAGNAQQQAVYTTINGACELSPLAAFCPFVTHYAADQDGNYFINPQGLVAGTVNLPATIAAGSPVLVQNVMKEIGGNKVPGSADLEANIVLTQLYQAMGGSGTLNLSYHYKDCLLYTSPSPRD